MLGTARQIVAASFGEQSLEDKAFEQRTAGFRRYRMATPYWRGVVLDLLQEWYATGAPKVQEDVDEYPVASLLGMPPNMGTAGRATGAELVRDLEVQGWGVVLVPEGENGTLVRTKSAAIAEDLTLGDQRGTTVVLSEPSGGWQDKGSWQYAIFPATFALGLLAAAAGMSIMRS